MPNWSLFRPFRPAAFNVNVINVLNLKFLQEVAQTCGHAAEMKDEAKHFRNDEACAISEWSSIPLVVKVFGGWDNEATMVFTTLSKKYPASYINL